MTTSQISLNVLCVLLWPTLYQCSSQELELACGMLANFAPEAASSFLVVSLETQSTPQLDSLRLLSRANGEAKLEAHLCIPANARKFFVLSFLARARHNQAVLRPRALLSLSER